jgi:hypothetical protein
MKILKIVLIFLLTLCLKVIAFPYEKLNYQEVALDKNSYKNFMENSKFESDKIISLSYNQTSKSTNTNEMKYSFYSKVNKNKL